MLTRLPGRPQGAHIHNIFKDGIFLYSTRVGTAESGVSGPLRLRSAFFFVSASILLLGIISCGGGGLGISAPAPAPTPAPAPAPSTLSNGAVARFLDQASFGATTATISRVRQLDGVNPRFGMSDYIDEQMDPARTPPSAWPDIPAPLPPGAPCPNAPMDCLQQNWFRNALLGPDQLRQRTAFALSQIWVISGIAIDIPAAYNPYIRMLNNGAFTTYDQLMKDVTLSPAMGWYLDMANSAKARRGAVANENYARELLQLFTLGAELLNEDGTPKLDNQGKAIPTYDQATVQNLARALTGWTYKTCCGIQQAFPVGVSHADWTSNMIPFDGQHDTGAKTLLNGQVLAAGQSTQRDLDAALANIFVHPNLPPFISKQLIQHLITSNPSPAYVARISAVFRDNGFGVRGDLAAVIKAILLDSEARQGDSVAQAASFGHLREPVLFMTATLRALGFSVSDANLFARSLAASGRKMGQNVLFAPNVFNYFPPSYTVPGTQLLGPEFAILTTATAPARANWIDSVVRNGLTGQGIAIDLSLLRTLSPEQLVDQLGQRFLYEQMPADMRNTLLNALSHLPKSSDPDVQARTAIYLVLTSNHFQIVH